jgi:hypothetical protein
MKKYFLLICCASLFVGCNKPAEQVAEPVVEAKPLPTEFADLKYMEMGKQGIASLASGDVDGWMSSFADNAVYVWSSGDSLVGKQAITEYWKDRRNNVIDSLTFMNDVWLPIQVNEPQRSVVARGVWLLSWYQVVTKYKNGKKIGMWIHTDLHFDNNDKIDRAIQYIDRAPINAALAKK